MLADLVMRFGYVMVFAAAAVEGDATLVTATFLAHRGYLRLLPVIVAAALGTIGANQAYYWIGRSRRRQPGDISRSRIYAKVASWIGRYGLQLVLASRFIYGFRVAIPLACGASGMTPRRFTAGDVTGAVVWSTVVGFAGFATGQILDRLIQDLRRYEWWIALALLVGGTAILIGYARDWPALRLLRRRQDNDAKP